MKWTAQARPDAASTLLAEEVRRAGYYPELVLGTLDAAVAGEEIVVDLVQAETTFDDAVHRHLTVLALTASRLIIVHVDDVPREDAFRDSERGGENRRVLFRLFRHCRAFLDAFEGASTIYTPHGPLREDIRTVRRRSENVSNSEAHRVDALVYLRRTSVKSGTTGIQPRDVAVSTA